MDCRGSIDDCVRSIDKHQHSPEISKSRIRTPEYEFAISSEPLSESCLQYVSTRMLFREKRHDDTPCQAKKNAVSSIYETGQRTGWLMPWGAESRLIAQKCGFWLAIADSPCARSVIKRIEMHLVCQSNGQSRTVSRHRDTAFFVCRCSKSPGHGYAGSRSMASRISKSVRWV